MDKKQIVALIEEIVATVAARDNLSEGEARTFVGVALRTNKDAFIETIRIPKLTIAKGTEEATETADAA